jgi:putative membrane protein
MLARARLETMLQIMIRISRGTVPLVLAAALLRCGGSEQPAAAPNPAPTLAPAELPPAPTSGPDAGAPPDSASPASDPTLPAASKPDTLTDEQIAAITDAANTAEIEEGKLARLKSKDAAVQKFAARMIAAHEEAKKNQDKLKLPTAESALGNTLGTEAASTMSALKGAEAKDFDRAYIEAQVRAHQKLLDALNDQLIPDVKNPDLKAYLSQIQPHVARHLKEAQELQHALPGKAASVAASNTGK